MLELRPNCEHCDRDLPPGMLDVRVCSFECTFCADCCNELLGGVCPNCGGELVVRPVRPSTLLTAAPPGRERTHSPVDLDAHDAALATRPCQAEHPGTTLLRYVRAWRTGDLAALVDCYHEEFTLHYYGSSRFAGIHRGRERALEVMAEVTALAPRELVSVEELLLGDTAGALVVTERLSREGERAKVRRTLEYRVASNGRLTECHLWERDQATVDHFWR